MRKSSTLSDPTASALKALMNSILSEDYIRVFHIGNVLLAAIQDLEQSDELRLLKSAVDGICNAIERLFYKEKIVLFPYLEKHFTPDGKIKTHPAIKTSMEEGLRSTKMISSFKELAFGSEAKKTAMLPEENLKNVFSRFEQAWISLCTQREQLFNSFLV